MSEIDWAKAPEGASHYVIGLGFFKLDLAGWFICDDGEKVWRKTPYQSPDNFSWWGNAVERPSPTWSGEGLPPVGSTCEYIGGKHGMPEPWPVEIVHHYHGGACMAAAFLYARDGQTRVAGAIDSCFRPIRTPEQIAADERTKACDRMYGVILDSIPEERRKNGSDICEALYDAGYRKVEQPK